MLEPMNPAPPVTRNMAAFIRRGPETRKGTMVAMPRAALHNNERVRRFKKTDHVVVAEGFYADEQPLL
jgi:hypothetical protein